MANAKEQGGFIVRRVMAKRYTEEQVKQMEEKLIEAIREFVGLFHRKPSEAEVIDWVEMYGLKPNGLHNGWAKNLIYKATWGMGVWRKNHRKSSFVLYGVENNVPDIVLRKSIDLEVAIR